jgi:8-oxo-dGTP pyrophosphatase MutT (NUDIX family)
MTHAHKAVAIVVIQDKEGNFFVHRRNKAKKLFPGKYGLGAGGKLVPNEDPLVAAQRELQEETGLVEKVKPLFDISYTDETVTHTVHVNEVVIDHHNIQNHDAEWDWSGWMSKEEVDKLAAEEELMSDTIQFYKRYLSETNLA